MKTGDKISLFGIFLVLAAVALLIYCKITNVPIDGESVVWYVKIQPFLICSAIAFSMAGMRIKAWDRIGEAQEKKEKEKLAKMSEFEKRKKFQEDFKGHVEFRAVTMAIFSLILWLTIALNIIFLFTVGSVEPLIICGCILFFTGVPWASIRWGSTAKEVKQYGCWERKENDLIYYSDWSFLFIISACLLFCLANFYFVSGTNLRFLYLVAFVFGAKPIVTLFLWYLKQIRKEKENASVRI